MAKIIEITAEHVSIGMDDGSIREIRPSDVSFIPQIGDEVEIYETENRIIVQKKSSAPQTPEGGIHINVANTNQTPPQVLVSGGKVVNKVSYCVLALFLGGIGVHKFYAGQIGTGICYLLFCWTFIPGIIAFIEAIIALCKHADAAGNIVV